MKINKKFEPLIFSVLMILGISSIISFVMTSMNVGYTSLFFKSWMKAWGIAFVVKKIMKIFTFIENEA
ncbi:DUF2798 domain-containing protein [Lysinibacillus sp. NPDC093216]|uniref:DUF2798 domain-containing protein n=1 Tax=Lysinibacillus sp. NPDC093216 TaxID=3390576 RepID=UPI003D06B279